MRIGILTGGGDAPGLNGIIEATGKTLLQSGHEVYGIEEGFLGVFEGRMMDLQEHHLQGLHSAAGTLLGTTNKCGTEGREDEFLECFKRLKLDGIVVAGGDGTFAGLKQFESHIKIIGVPKTIDNDLSGTDYTFGYDTACSVVAESVDALRSTANAHNRVILVEAMGRTAGWIALGGGLASYADFILIPEKPFDRDHFIEFIKKQKSSKKGVVGVVSEGAMALGESPEIQFRVEGAPQAERYGGIAQKLAHWIESQSQWESRHVVLGHLQRAKSPTTTDRFLTLAMGVLVGQLVNEKKWGMAAVFRNGVVQPAPLEDLMKPARLVESDHRWVKMAQSVGIFI